MNGNHCVNDVGLELLALESAVPELRHDHGDHGIRFVGIVLDFLSGTSSLCLMQDAMPNLMENNIECAHCAHALHLCGEQDSGFEFSSGVNSSPHARATAFTDVSKFNTRQQFTKDVGVNCDHCCELASLNFIKDTILN